MDSDDDDDWENLQTIQKFDGVSNNDDGDSIIAENSFTASTQLYSNGLIDRVAAKASTPVSLLVESLVQQLCMMLENDPKKSMSLYHTICERLHSMNLIDETYAMGEFEMMRSQYQRALYQLVSIARGQDLPITLQTVWPLSQTVGLEWSRYHREFEELSFIAGGGFGKVFRARNNLDGIEYAIKKITIRSTTINNVLLHLAEVKTLASLNHINIVPYKAAWLEPLLAKPGVDDDQPSTVVTPEDEDDDEDSDNSVFESNHWEADDYSFSKNQKEDSLDFIHFETSEGNSANNEEADVSDDKPATEEDNKKIAEIKKSSIQIEESLPHLNLKWATLYIQMTLCHLTLREWLDERNKNEDFTVFYANFLTNPKNRYRRTSYCQSTYLHLNTTKTSSSTTSSCSNGSNGFVKDVKRIMTCKIEENVKMEEESVSNEEKPVPEHIKIATNIFNQLLNGLNYIHSRGIVHHDIKPSNIFISLEDNNQLVVQLGDFGLACPLQKTHTGVGFGTPLYAAPEQLEGRCDQKSDIYSLGIILLELLINFSTDMERAEMIKDVRKGKLPSTLDINFASILKSLLQHRSAKRPSIMQLIEALNSMKTNKDKVIVELQQRLSLRDEEIQQLKTQMDEHKYTVQTELKSKTTEILKKQQELRRQSIEIETKMEELRRKDRELHTKMVCIERKDNELKMKDEEIIRLREQLLKYQQNGK